ncbi:MAG: 50S ribosomal protein L11 methyltransferase, partial [Paracoccaceae bacterium]|nr:50S ribosomal protein L11 methyltransferase [Paracoccaceae bacterium]
KGCLLALEYLLNDGLDAKNIIDVGCGTAVLAMAAASVFSANVTAIDIDAVAVSVAKTNVQANDLDRNIRCFESNGFGHSQINTIETFDLIFANILMAPLLSMAEDMFRHTVSGGYVILSGILTEQTELVTNKYIDVGFSLTKQINIAEWSTLIFTKIK